MESGYSKYRNPYHNLLHAADVLQTTYQIIYNSGLMVEVNGVSLSLYCFLVPALTLASSSVLHVHTALHRRHSSDTLPLSLSFAAYGSSLSSHLIVELANRLRVIRDVHCGDYSRFRTYRNIE